MNQTQRHLVGLESLTTEAPLPLMVRRPGERREPLAVEVDPGPFVQAAGAYGLSIPGSVELALEFTLVGVDLDHLGKKHAARALAERAEAERISSAIAPPMARYVRTLWNPRPRRIDPIELEQPIDVPLRLFPRVLGIDAREALTPSRLAQAVKLERAAVGAGRTMSEYALLFVARL